MKNLIVALILCLGFLSCNKESKVPSTETKQLDSGKKIKVYLYTHQDGQTLNFSVGYRNAAVADELSNALWYLHNRLLTNDTTKGYLYPYTSVVAKSGFIYAYPDSALQASADFSEFQAWFQKIVTNWMTKHECSGCSNITVTPGVPDCFLKIKCSVQ